MNTVFTHYTLGLNSFFAAFPIRPSFGPTEIVKYKDDPGCSIQNSTRNFAVANFSTTVERVTVPGTCFAPA